MAGGQLLAGFFSSGDSWRVPFLIVSSPTIIFCALIFLFVEEPKRAGKASESERALRTHSGV